MTGSFFYLTSCDEHSSSAAAKPAVQKDTNSAVISKQVWKDVAAAEKMLQDGDLVTRSDDDFESITLQNFSNTDRTYSHSGIAFKEDSGFVVYHSMTGAENPSGSCRKDPIDSFVNPVKKTGFGIFRYALSAHEKEQLHAIVKHNHQVGIPFDVTFNINSDDSLYCSEMIYKGLKAATNNRIVLPVTLLKNFRPKIMGYKYNQAFLKKFEYISIDNLYLNSFCKEVIRVKYR
jgi:uncharacterized protein YycO